MLTPSLKSRFMQEFSGLVGF